MADNVNAAVVVTVDITETGRARIAGPGFAGYVARGHAGRHPVTHRPRYSVTLTDDTPELLGGDREPLAPLTRAARAAFPETAVAFARLLAAHYHHTDVRIELHDETGTHAIPQEV